MVQLDFRAAGGGGCGGVAVWLSVVVSKPDQQYLVVSQG